MQDKLPVTHAVVNLSQMAPMMHLGNLGTINGIQVTGQQPTDNTNALNATIATLTAQNQYANNGGFVHQQQQQQQQQQQNNNIYI